ncbi:hypothetical protein [Providencia stuartii]|uniref:hypothetical protein n=1 Tax=Providencia stuartii TaxID=588 RepID=UPI0023AFCCBA|nr:hypothetical protein [Providencia thailandensis]MDE8748603.1 hypothetical protein [Providencia thailandensis]MDE8767900.1 hypothetical protein [Providencia thailandensis]MDE8780413.1 hypothetical protein [Providencia thailandensis]MDE8784409.1 hypothetical protein [Providencia thailandensis]MDE8788394.1 hypothetical protein [Providencia thailandensis]
MKKIAILYIMVAALHLTACDKRDGDANKVSSSSAKSVIDDRYIGPFGLQWGSSLEGVMAEIGNNAEVLSSQSECPFIKVKTQKLPYGLNNKDEIYKLKFLPENDEINFSGLMVVEYDYTTTNKEIYKIDFNDILKNLELKYGNPIETKVDSEKSSLYVFENGNRHVMLSGSGSDGFYSIWMIHAFLPKEDKKEISQIMDKIKLECQKQRNPL